MSRWLSDRPSAPIITYYGPGVARVELSAATCANAVCKAANLFTDELMLQPGDTVWLDLPCHWQAPISAVAAWAAGLSVAVGPPPREASATISTGTTGPPLGVGLAVSLHPWGLPLGAATPAGWEDFAAVAQMQPDAAHWQWPRAGAVWLAGDEALSGDALEARAGDLVRSWAVPPAGRLLSTRGTTDITGLLACTVVPALVGGGVVLACEGDVGNISRQERNDATTSDV